MENKKARKLDLHYESDDTTAALPNEILTHIFSNLTIQEICSSASVSQRWKYAMLDDCLWKNCCNRDYPILSSKYDSDIGWLSFYQKCWNYRLLIITSLRDSPNKFFLNERLVNKHFVYKHQIHQIHFRGKYIDTTGVSQDKWHQFPSQYSCVVFVGYVTDSQDTLIGNFLADFAESGGSLLLFPLVATRAFSLQGRWDKYSPLETVDMPSTISEQDLGKILIPNHPLLNGIENIHISLVFSECKTVKENAQVVVEYTNGTPLAIISKQYKIIYLNFIPVWPLKSSSNDNQQTQLTINALSYYFK